MVAEKDFNKPEHPEVKGARNLEVIKSMQVSFLFSFFLFPVSAALFVLFVVAVDVY